jgi:hypothetical protein
VVLIPISTRPTVLGVGEKWIFSYTSRSFGYGYEAVRIRVKYKMLLTVYAC